MSRTGSNNSQTRFVSIQGIVNRNDGEPNSDKKEGAEERAQIECEHFEGGNVVDGVSRRANVRNGQQTILRAGVEGLGGLNRS